MEPITSNRMREIENWAINELGIPQIVLMENAGIKTFEAIRDNYGIPKTACVICGKGKNGGDAAVVARYLKNNGCDVYTFVVGKDDINCFEERLQKTQVVVDGIFGSGLDRDVEGMYAEIIGLVNKNKEASRYKVVSVDIPSGLDANTGEIKGQCVDADLTVTFHLPKIGMFMSAALSKSGKIVIADIGIPYDRSGGTEARSETEPKLKTPNIVDVDYIKDCLPERKIDSNKGDNGRVMIIAGSRGMSGAAVMSGKAALRTGAGLVYLSVPKEIQNPVNISVPEIITLADASIEEMRSIKLSAIGMGPGIGAGKKDPVEQLIRSDMKCPLIIDADALNAISNDPGILLKRKCPVIITPHPGEMARLLKTTTAKIQENRIDVALKAAYDWSVIVVLKGAYTVIAHPCGRHFINITGNPGLATAGTGDVLTGIICSLAGQGIEPFSAAVCGVFIHGMCADVVALNKGQMGMIASDIIEAIPFVINSITKAA